MCCIGAVTYEDLQSKVASDESPDDQEESSSVYDQTDGGGGTGTRNEASHRSSSKVSSVPVFAVECLS